MYLKWKCLLVFCCRLQEEASALLLDLSSSLNTITVQQDAEDDVEVVFVATPIVEAASNILIVSSDVRTQLPLFPLCALCCSNICFDLWQEKVSDSLLNGMNNIQSALLHQKKVNEGPIIIDSEQISVYVNRWVWPSMWSAHVNTQTCRAVSDVDVDGLDYKWETNAVSKWMRLNQTREMSIKKKKKRNEHLLDNSHLHTVFKKNKWENTNSHLCLVETNSRTGFVNLGLNSDRYKGSPGITWQLLILPSGFLLKQCKCRTSTWTGTARPHFLFRHCWLTSSLRMSP